MKGRVEHMVPLSTRALAVLEEVRELAGGPGTEAVFPNREGRFFGESRFGLLLRALKVEAVPHGFRSSLRSWCADTSVDRELAEACLAHTVGNQVELAYKRTLIMERRRPIMEAWAEYVGEGTGSAAAARGGALGQALARSRQAAPASAHGSTCALYRKLVNWGSVERDRLFGTSMACRILPLALSPLWSRKLRFPGHWAS